MSARLPVEILEKVVSDFDPYGSVQALDLLSLSQVSRDWHNVALPAVHKTIYIQNPRDKTLSAILSFLQRFGIAGVTDSHNETVWDWGDDSDNEGEFEGPPVERGAARFAMDAPTQRLWHCYNESEKLAALPREIYFQGPFESASAASAIRRFLHVCPNVRSIRLFHKPTMDSFQMHRRKCTDDETTTRTKTADTAPSCSGSSQRCVRTSSGSKRRRCRTIRTISSTTCTISPR